MENEKRTQGKKALAQNIESVKILGSMIRTTLGPKGMDKMLMTPEGKLIMSNDGVTIIDKIQFDHPAGLIIKGAAKTQEKEVADGTTTVVMLAGELLARAEQLIDKNIHPTIILGGYELAKRKAIEILKGISIENQTDEMLQKISETALTGKSAEGLREDFSKIVVEAVKLTQLDHIDYEGIKIVKTTAESERAELVKGVVIEKEIPNDSMPKKLKDAKIALIDYDLEVRNMERDSQIQINDPSAFQKFVDAEQKQLDNMVDKIVEVGANVVFCNKGIDDYIFSRFAKKGILAIRRVMKGELERLARATGGRIVSKQTELTSEDLGFSGQIYQKKFKADSLIYVTECANPKDVSIVVYGSTDYLVDELARAITDAIGDVISVYNHKDVVAGGGAVEMELSKRLTKYATSLPGREQLAVLAFAEALESIPTALAENAGMDPVDVITELKASHDAGHTFFGLNLFTGKIEDTMKAGIVEPTKNKHQAIASATEVSKSILRIDDILISKPESQ